MTTDPDAPHPPVPAQLQVVIGSGPPFVLGRCDVHFGSTKSEVAQLLHAAADEIDAYEADPAAYQERVAIRNGWGEKVGDLSV